VKIRKALVTAGGYGTRMLPLTKAYTKEMLPLGRKPALHYIVDELHGAGIPEVIISTRLGKQDIQNYFAGMKGVQIRVDREIRGTGHAIFVNRDAFDNQPFAVILGDSPLRGNPAHQLVQNMMNSFFDLDCAVLMAMYEAQRSEAPLHGILVREHKVGCSPVKLVAMQEKPQPSEALSDWASACRYIVHPRVLDLLEDLPPAVNGEIQFTDAIKILMANGERVYGLSLAADQKRYDIGNFKGYFEAFAEFAGES